MGRMVVVARDEDANRLLDYLIVYKKWVTNNPVESPLEENVTVIIPEPELIISK